MSEVLHSEEDIKTASFIFQRAIEYLKIPNETTPESAKEFLGEDGKIDLTKVQLVTIRDFGDGTKVLHGVYFYDDFLTVSMDTVP